MCVCDLRKNSQMPCGKKCHHQRNYALSEWSVKACVECPRRFTLLIHWRSKSVLLFELETYSSVVVERLLLCIYAELINLFAILDVLWIIEVVWISSRIYHCWSLDNVVAECIGRNYYFCENTFLHLYYCGRLFNLLRLVLNSRINWIF